MAVYEQDFAALMDVYSPLFFAQQPYIDVAPPPPLVRDSFARPATCMAEVEALAGSEEEEWEEERSLRRKVAELVMTHQIRMLGNK
eukprot:748095-Hanusia_phi.AAC.6